MTKLIGKQLFIAYLFFAILSEIAYTLNMDFTIFKPDEDEESKPGTPADSAEGSTTAEKVGNIVSFSVESPDPYMSVAEAAEML